MYEIIHHKRKNLKSIRTAGKKIAAELTAVNCFKILTRGIEAVIFDYETDKHFEVVLKLNESKTKLVIENKNQSLLQKYFSNHRYLVLSS